MGPVCVAEREGKASEWWQWCNVATTGARFDGTERLQEWLDACVEVSQARRQTSTSRGELATQRAIVRAIARRRIGSVYRRGSRPPAIHAFVRRSSLARDS